MGWKIFFCMVEVYTEFIRSLSKDSWRLSRDSCVVYQEIVEVYIEIVEDYTEFIQRLYGVYTEFI